MPRTRLRTKRTTPPAAPVTSTKADPLAWGRAYELAGGDVSRMVVLADGSVLVLRPTD